MNPLTISLCTHNRPNFLTGNIILSFIIPVFNRELTIDGCIDSILSSKCNLDEIEIILVDDCSTDSSVDICKRYCADHSNIRLLYGKINSGPGASRNIGLDVASGEYVLFLDSDDAVNSDNLHLLIDHLKNKPEIVMFNTYSTDYKGFKRRSTVEILKEENLTSVDFWEKFKNKVFLSIWGFCFKLEVIGHIRFKHLRQQCIWQQLPCERGGNIKNNFVCL